ncbi:response regulator [uncultured Psychroserpens sp.]|uniref:response regulator n=1 Tax=uncultured Psychroserpens sp. TaxID=255436 RepID=UPI00262C245D|nr:response regulator [uncultured Psychroserpens sp.]
MEHKTYSVLIVDDHPLITEAYKSAFNYYSDQNDFILFSIKTAESCDDAFKLINDYFTKKNDLDIVFLDIKLPPSKDGKILSGEDLGLRINKLLPDTKIIISTTLNDNYRVHSIFKSLDPDGFLIKNDITPKDLVEAIDTVINDPPHYSKTVVKLLRKQVTNDFLLDNIDRKILYELSIGTKMKDLPSILPLSIAGIEKRKRHLKHIFNIKSPDDKELLLKAKEKGFI